MSHRLANLTPPASCALESIGMALIIKHSLIDFFLRVENEGTVLNDFLVERETGHEDCDRNVLALHMKDGGRQERLVIDAVQEIGLRSGRPTYKFDFPR